MSTPAQQMTCYVVKRTFDGQTALVCFPGKLEAARFNTKAEAEIIQKLCYSYYRNTGALFEVVEQLRPEAN